MAITLERDLDPHEAPPLDMKDVFKKYQKLKPAQLAQDPGLIDIGSSHGLPVGFKSSGSIPATKLQTTFGRFIAGNEIDDMVLSDAEVYSSQDLPGLLILPSLLPPAIQKELLSRMMHRDLSDQRHKTNLDFHHFITRPERGSSRSSTSEETIASFFSLPLHSTSQFQPKDPAVHKALSAKQVLEKKLRWITLGGQYDWTNKVYPEEQPPDFPSDIADLVGRLFPEMKAEAAIVNLYSPGDTLSLHRDVSEEVDRGLVSISLGCDCLFIIGLGGNKSKDERKASQETSRYLTLRLRSGDAVYMSKEARFAWHGVPKVISNTCPEYLADWPADTDSRFEVWRGWMSNKRINLNIRQMRE